MAKTARKERSRKRVYKSWVHEKTTDAATKRRKQMQKNIDHLQEHGHKRRTIMSGERATRSVREGVSPGLLSSHYQHDVFRLTGLGIMGGWLWVRPRLNPMAHDDIKFYSKTPN